MSFLSIENRSTILRTAMIITALIVIGVFIWWQKRPTAKPKTEPVKIINTDELETISSFKIDTDGDGLKDWEEDLWRTDKKNKDTDGDGTNDNKEIILGRDPLKAGPNDKKADDTKPLYARADDENLTVSEKFQRDFYRTLDVESDINPNPDIQGIFSDLSTKYLSENPIKQPYTKKDLQIVDNTEENKTIFQEQWKVLYTEYAQVLSKDNIAIMKNIMQNKPTSNTTNLISSLKNLEIHTKQISVPQIISNDYLNLLNGIGVTRMTLLELQKSSAPDKMMTAILAKGLGESLLNLQTGIEKINNY